VDGLSSEQIDVTSAATNPSAVQLQQAGIPLQQGVVYMVQFWAKADSARAQTFALNENTSSFAGGEDVTVFLGATWQQYVIYWQAPATDPSGSLAFYFGGQTGNTWLDAVSLRGM
jgi:hypothetical protein